jgi:hypothetical protein
MLLVQLCLICIQLNILKLLKLEAIKLLFSVWGIPHLLMFFYQPTISITKKTGILYIFIYELIYF